MLNKSQIATVAETMIVGSIAALGFVTASPIAAAVLLGIGLYLASNITQKGFTKLKEDWLLSRNGILRSRVIFNSHLSGHLSEAVLQNWK